MFRLPFKLALANTAPVKARRNRVSDDTFRRKMETSDTLRHMCGFDTELYQAISDMGR